MFTSAVQPHVIHPFHRSGTFNLVSYDVEAGRAGEVVVQPRFLFTSALAGEDAGIQLWPGTWGPVHEADDRARIGVAWRLVGANNRELGRSVQVYADVVACHADVMGLKADITSAHSEVAFDNATGRWTWMVDLQGVPVAISAREYWRQRECEYNLTQFLIAVPNSNAAQAVGVRPKERPLQRPNLDIPEPREPIDEPHCNSAAPSLGANAS